MHSTHWYVALTKPRSEQLANLELTNQGYTTYLPLIHHTSLQAGKAVKPAKPLFPRYIFIAKVIEQDTRPIRSTKGVVELVRFGTHIATIRGEVITQLKEREHLISQRLEDEATLHPGDMVEITSGMFEGYEAIFTEPDGDKRATLLLKIMHTEQRISLETEHIQKIAKD